MPGRMNRQDPENAQASTAGRGVDFEHRFNTSRWAEDLLCAALNTQPSLCCIRLGLSQVQRGRRIATGDENYKEPDLLVFRRHDLTPGDMALLDRDLTAISPVQLLEDTAYRSLIRKAVAAIEVEFSPYKAAEMKDRGWTPKTAEDLARRPRKHANPPTAPNLWIKDEDLPCLTAWQQDFQVPIHVVHLFDQEAFSVRLSAVIEHQKALDRLDRQGQINLQLSTGIFRKDQSYDRSDAQGAGEVKTVFVVTPNASATTKAGDVRGVRVTAQIGESTSKKYVAHVLFEGGSLHLTTEFIASLQQ